MLELSEIKEEVKGIRNKQHSSEVSLTVLEALAQERHSMFLEQMTTLRESIKQDRKELEGQITHLIKSLDEVNSKLNALSSLAIKGTTSLRTLWFLGGLLAGISGILATWWDYLKF